MNPAQGGAGDADVIVVGAGPAGAATALALAARGAGVALIHTERCAAPVGETVGPAILQHLRALGLDEEFTAAGHLPAPGTVVCWGEDTPFERDAIANPYGPGWHLDRPRFDGMLRTAAQRHGVRRYTVDRYAAAHRDGRTWRVPVAGYGDVRAPMLVDASGRGARFAALAGARRRHADRMVGLLRFGAAGTDDHRTTIEACPWGWWYATPLPDGRAVEALLTDADLLPPRRSDRVRFFDGILAQTELTRTVLAPGSTQVRAVSAVTGALNEVVGADWVAVGDAARTLDPLSGRGVVTACEAALQVADALCSAGRDTALSAYSRSVKADHHRHVRDGTGYYRREQRWPRQPFWARRQHRRSVDV